MKKSELRTGMWVICKNRNRGMVLLNTKDGDIISGDTNWCSLNRYDENLNHLNRGYPLFNIVKVIQPSAHYYYYYNINKDDKYEVIWDKEKEYEPVNIIINATVNPKSITDVENVIKELQEKLNNLKINLSVNETK